MQTPDPAALEMAHSYESGVVPYVTAPCATILLENAKPQPGDRVVDVATGTGIVARRFHVQPETFAVQFSCGDPDEVRQMLGDAGFRATGVAPCTLMIRQPRPPNHIGVLITAARKMLPAIDAMSDEERAGLAREVENECADMLAKHTLDGQLVYPLSLHIHRQGPDASQTIDIGQGRAQLARCNIATRLLRKCHRIHRRPLNTLSPDPRRSSGLRLD